MMIKLTSKEYGVDIVGDGNSDTDIRDILSMKTIAVVGMSKDPSKPSYFVSMYMMDHGYHVIPVNPTASEILGLKSYGSLLDVPDKIDIVDIFRRAEDIPPIVDAAIKIGAMVVWMQEGIYNEEAAKNARKNGIRVVWNRCVMKEHRRLL